MIKILVVDDSLIFRKSIEKALSKVDNIQIIGSVWNGVKALEFIKNIEIPNLITLDVEMPEMNGLQTLQEIQKINATLPKDKKIEVIMVSSLTRSGANETIQALQDGAFDFVTKPSNLDPELALEELRKALESKIALLNGNYKASGNSSINKIVAGNMSPKSTSIKAIEVIAIGISTGGPKALGDILPILCTLTDLPIIIVQHMPKEFTKSFADNLNKKCNHEVIEAEDNTKIRKKTVYIAPGGMHLCLRRNEMRDPIVVLSDNAPENNSKPSVDVLFRSLADVYGNKAIAVVMTGMGNDGAKGVLPLFRAGAEIIAQDKDTSVVWGMPGSAVQTGCVAKVVALNKIPSIIQQIINQRNQNA